MDTEIIIAGGGLVGNALALALAKVGIRVMVIDPLPREVQLDTGFDGRTSAISAASVKVLNHVGAWEHIAPFAQPIHDIRVCDQDKPGYVHYADKDVGEPFGYIIENQRIRRGIYLALEAASGIDVRQSKVTGFVNNPQSITAELEDGSTITAPLMVAADGRFSKLRDAAKIKHHVISYHQTAIVCVIEHEHPHEGLALEKFYPAGPFAILPLVPNDAGVNRSGIVWTEHDDDAPNFIALSEDDFNAELQRRTGDPATCYWGKVKVVGKRFAYPLKLMRANTFYAPRFVLVGDAAHGVHPIAGQGVNLGYRDVAVLAELLADQRKLGLDLGANAVLAHYEQWRKLDSVTMTAGTDILNRLFSNNLPGVGLMRRAGMVAVEHMPPLKRFFMKHAMGLVGDLPKMLKDAA